MSKPMQFISGGLAGLTLAKKPKDSVRFTVWSDLHAHSWKGLENNALFTTHILKAIQYIFNVAAVSDSDGVIFLGDLFESKINWKSDIVGRTIQELCLNAKNFLRLSTKKTVYFIAGNHDHNESSEDKTPAFGILRECFAEYSPEQVCVLSSGSSKVLSFCSFNFNVHGNCLLASYNTSKESINTFNAILKEPIRVAFCHGPVRGACMTKTKTNGLQDMQQADIFNAKLSELSTIICGHYHIPQEFKTRLAGGEKVQVYGVGAPLQLSWSDADSEPCERGCLVCDITNTKVSVTRIAFESTPRFYSKFSSDTVRSIDIVQPTLCDASNAADIVKTYKGAFLGVSRNPLELLSEYVKVKGLRGKQAENLLKLGINIYSGKELIE